MSDIVSFTYNVPANIRTINRDNEPWFVAKDVCEILGLNDVSKACERLESDDKGVHPIPTPGGTQEMLVINEPGLYWLIVRSDKPAAKPFIRWVTHEVLPSIRKTGGYELPGRRVLGSRTKWGRQPVMDAIKRQGRTQGRFTQELIASEKHTDGSLNAGKIMSYFTGKVLPTETMITCCEAVLGLGREQLFTPEVLEAYPTRGVGRRH